MIIKIPTDLAHEIDRVAGRKMRSAFVVDVLRREVRRLRQRAALKLSAGAWRTEDHPELLQGGAAYVEQIRSDRD
ncbi:MAG TPA: hypothetical protein VK335_32595 [Bryobacteraceae bacterium]|nr:hypothetical protein [Bryobacteraceae bacterium]